MSLRSLIPIASAIAGSILCGLFWLAVMMACGIPGWAAGPIAAVGTAFAAGFWIGISLDEED